MDDGKKSNDSTGCPCGCVSIFANTEDWETPVCHSCYEKATENFTVTNITATIDVKKVFDEIFGDKK
jgi:hypothetical protein